MALIKEKSEFGFPVNYWRITQVMINRKNKTGNIGVELFCSKEAERSVDFYNFPIKAENFSDFFDAEGIYKDLYNACYEYIKATYPEMTLVDDIEEKEKQRELSK